MAKICDQLRLNARTKMALEEYDATTLEDLAYMTNEDYESMLATAARQGRPLCPLQQRKVAVLLWWVRNLVKDSSTIFQEEINATTKKPNMWERILHTPLEWHCKVHSTENSTKVVNNTTWTGIPRNWEEQFQKDFPMLKKKLKEVGEISSFSLYSDYFINIRWILCGYRTRVNRLVVRAACSGVDFFLCRRFNVIIGYNTLNIHRCFLVF
jgi:hypothetical protein